MGIIQERELAGKVSSKSFSLRTKFHQCFASLRSVNYTVVMPHMRSPPLGLQSMPIEAPSNTPTYLKCFFSQLVTPVYKLLEKPRLCPCTIQISEGHCRSTATVIEAYSVDAPCYYLQLAFVMHSLLLPKLGTFVFGNMQDGVLSTFR